MDAAVERNGTPGRMKVRVCENFISMIHISALTSWRSHEIPIGAHEASVCILVGSVRRNIYDQRKVKVHQSITFPSFQCIFMVSFCVLVSGACKKELNRRLYSWTRFFLRRSFSDFYAVNFIKVLYAAENNFEIYG